MTTTPYLSWIMVFIILASIYLVYNLLLKLLNLIITGNKFMSYFDYLILTLYDKVN